MDQAAYITLQFLLSSLRQPHLSLLTESDYVNGIIMWCRRSSLSLKRVSGRYASSLGSDPICELASSTLRYGPSSTSEVGHNLAYMNAKRILLFVDPHVASLDPFETVVSSIEQHVPAGHVLDIYNKIRVEPNNDSFKHAIKFMAEKSTNQGPYDAIIALGGGSTIDTAKAANLYTCYPPDDFYDYVNPPLGKGLPVPGPLTPLIAIPTTSGTGSETTGVGKLFFKDLNCLSLYKIFFLT